MPGLLLAALVANARGARGKCLAKVDKSIVRSKIHFIISSVRSFGPEPFRDQRLLQGFIAPCTRTSCWG